MNKPARIPPVIWLIALVNVLLHLYAADKLEYHRDELLYFALGYHPAAGYASVPPLIGWLAAGIRAVAGTSVVAVKLLPALLSGVLVVLGAAIVGELRGGKYAAVLTALCLITMPSLLRTFHLFQPVHLDILWWTVLGWLTLRYVNSTNKTYLLYLGAALGMALLTKYLVLLYAAGLLLGLLLYRPVTFREPCLYYGGLLALGLFLPNLIWQVAHDFPVFAHLRALEESQLVHVSRLDFLADQLLMAFAGSLLLVPGLFFVFRQRGYLGVAAVFTLLALLLLRGKSYYTIGLFPPLVAAGAVWWEQVLRWKPARALLPFCIVLINLLILPVGLPVVDAAGLTRYFRDLDQDYGIAPGRRWEDGKLHDLPQDYADQLGWRELTDKVAAAYHKEPDPAAVMIFCENYGQAAALRVIGEAAGLPEPVSFSDAFNAWVPRGFDPPVTVLYYINDEQGEDVTELFASVAIIAAIENPHAREYGSTIYRFSHPKQPFSAFWAEVLARNPSPY